MNWFDWLIRAGLTIRDFLYIFLLTYFLRVKNQLSSSSKRVA